MRSLFSVAENYDRYFSSQLYDQRYPSPNPSSLALVVHEIPRMGGRILDFGCGNGRYTMPLLERTDATVIACDISQAAIDELSLRCSRHIETGRLRPVLGDLSVLTDTMGRDEGFDLAILMFGVLGHIFPRALRQETLATLRGLLRPGGRIIVTVPNAARRFFKRQVMARRLTREKHLEPGDIFYERIADHAVIKMYYHLYTIEEFVQELEQQGFRPIHVGAESVLPESSVVRSTPLRWIDRLLAATMPLRCAYGFLAVAEVASEPDRVARLPNALDPDMPGQARRPWAAV